MQRGNRSTHVASCDVLVIGSGAAGLCAALAASARGSSVVVIEKADVIGGTSALSGAGTWAPLHPHLEETGATDSREEVLEYIRAVSPERWHNAEQARWEAFVDHAGPMIGFLEQYSPLRFKPNTEPDPYVEAPGGKRFGRMLSPQPLSRWRLKTWRRRIRGPSYVPYLNYGELCETPFMVRPLRGLLRLAPRLVYRLLTGQATMGTALVSGLLGGFLDLGCEVQLGTR
ncbi:MAG: dehydrogenase, partial [Thiotrichales bacterium]|nr:dehydrogenase [Thiotrichales bacterium]